MFYIDDSGAEKTGWVVYSWIECSARDWSKGLRAWLNLRHNLFAQHGIEAAYELHATKFVPGRGNPSTNPEWNRLKRNRGEVMEQALAAIGQCEHLQVGTVWRKVHARRHYREQKIQTYQALVEHLDSRLAHADELGLVFMDGDGTDSAYRMAHRELKLADRRIIEDPIFQGSHISQWVQMADLAAYAAYQGLLRHEGKEFTWEWYDRYLRDCDVNGGPHPI